VEAEGTAVKVLVLLDHKRQASKPDLHAWGLGEDSEEDNI
jgi:hypothetical protein